MVDYLKLLSAENPYDRLDAWFKVDWLIKNNIVPVEQFINLKEKFIELLNYEDETVRLHAWKLLPQVMKENIINFSDINKEMFLNTLHSPEGWLLVKDLLDLKVITYDDVLKYKKYFMEFLEGSDLDRISAWSLVNQMIQIGIVSRDEVKKLKNKILSLLKFDDKHIRFNVLFLVDELYKQGLIDSSDILQYKEDILRIVNDDQFSFLVNAYEKNLKDIEEILQIIK
ncbi:hypothetical protein DFR86_10375 [Acidianus sulfidivorans JP7]|uniref:hypothetical protein n=1 Tax=Acidianus sulfidivorans TaxID=312539 RepID=UPI00144367EC|nr:hypothetical protein [Acidianus sulfidivorans]AWR97902.2 hypothetical protein DFR86_10375 [Acidianus sulfidivorans JP7]